MKKIFYWSPCLNRVGTLYSTINSAISVKKYSKNFEPIIINSCGEWDNYTELFTSKFGTKNTLLISADIENQINQLENEEKKNYMKMINLQETGLNTLIKKGYELLELETFFTSGPEESRAWTVPVNCKAPSAAGTIHTDFEKGFIRAETVSYEEFIKNNGWLNSKNNGKMRLEGKDYVIKDGDVLNFRFNT